jgi:hypothetical protein
MKLKTNRSGGKNEKVDGQDSRRIWNGKFRRIYLTFLFQNLAALD